jgi:hypothetical protein
MDLSLKAMHENKYWIAFQSFPGLECLQLVHVSGFEGMTAYDLWETHGNRSRRIYIEGCAISYSFFVIVFPFILFYAESIPGG